MHTVVKSGVMTSSHESDTFDIGDDLTVHRLGFGAMSLAGSHNMGWTDDVNGAKQVLQHAIDLGVDFVDTADMYGNGSSELLVGDSVDAARDDVVIATKGGILKQPDATTVLNGEPTYLRNAALRSRIRLGVDAIDLYQYHRPDPDVPIEESARALADLVDAGVVRHVGLSNVTVDQIEAAREIVDIATVQNRFNIGDREQGDVLDACEDAGIGFIPWYPLGAGDLGDKADAVEEIADAHDATTQQIALAWLLHRSEVTLPIPGTSSVDHLHDNVAATHIDLSDEEMSRLNE